MSLWLNIVGVGEGGVGELSATIKELVADAFTVIGPQRFLSTIAPPAESVEIHPELVQRRSLEAVARALLYVDDEEITYQEEDLSRVLIEWQPPIETMINQDGQTSQRLSALLGHNFFDDRLNLYGFAEYEKLDAVNSLDIDWRTRTDGQ